MDDGGIVGVVANGDAQLDSLRKQIQELGSTSGEDNPNVVNYAR
jgi:hypothetical protein